MTGPTCRFPASTRREFHRRGARPVKVGHEWRGRGSWASRRSLRPAVPCHPPTPPWLLCTGSFVLTGQDCPGIFGPLSGLRRRASGLHFWRPFRPGFSNRHPRRRCSDERRARAAVPFGVVGGRRLADPRAVFPPAPASLSEVFAPSAKQPMALAVAHVRQRSERRRKLFI